MSLEQSAIGRERVRIVGGSAEPIVSAATLAAAIEPEEIEIFRPLLPVGYAAGVRAYQAAVARLTATQLTTHYTSGLAWFHEAFVPELKQRLRELSGGVWSFDEHVAFAAGSDVDLMTHLIDAVALAGEVKLFPGDWHGFRVGSAHPNKIHWDAERPADLACLCVPSVRNGHVTNAMVDYLQSAPACLLNLNLYPTLNPTDRQNVASSLLPVMDRSLLSISFSRGFGLTASQLGVVLVPRSHPIGQRFATQLNWFTYFYNALAAQAFLELDLAAAQEIDRARARWVETWLEQNGLPVVPSGSYYVKAFRVDGELPDYFSPLMRDDIVRLCFKPPQS